MSTPPTAARLEVRQVHKGGEAPADCQDAWWACADLRRVAVADGATRSFFPREWAWLVARGWCERADPVEGDADGTAWLASPAAAWRERVEAQIEASPHGAMLQNRLARRDPAVATLAGVEVDGDGRGWRGWIVGDSCLFHLDPAGALLRAEPFRTAGAFDAHPDALLSQPLGQVVGTPVACEGSLGRGDRLVLATDALAKWLLTLPPETIGGVVDALLSRRFETEIEQARRGEGLAEGGDALEDDDVTLLVLRGDGAPPDRGPLDLLGTPYAPTWITDGAADGWSPGPAPTLPQGTPVEPSRGGLVGMWAGCPAGLQLRIAGSGWLAAALLAALHLLPATRGDGAPVAPRGPATDPGPSQAVRPPERPSPERPPDTEPAPPTPSGDTAAAAAAPPISASSASQRSSLPSAEEARPAPDSGVTSHPRPDGIRAPPATGGGDTASTTPGTPAPARRPPERAGDARARPPEGGGPGGTSTGAGERPPP